MPAMLAMALPTVKNPAGSLPRSDCSPITAARNSRWSIAGRIARNSLRLSNGGYRKFGRMTPSQPNGS